MSEHRPVRTLLTMGDYGGTLAALRTLARHGLQVQLADSRRWVPARFSRLLSEHLDCPPQGDWVRSIDWLLAYGKAHSGIFLYPTSDDTAWLYASYQEDLRPYFLLWQPDAKVIYTLLNKKLLTETCRHLNIPTPRTYFPESMADLKQMTSELRPPFLLKPRTQIGLKIGHKGRVVGTGDELAASYMQFKEQLRYQEQLLEYDPLIAWPMMQEYFAGAMQSIISIAGFVDASGRIVARSSRKVLQMPRRLGVGLCFESIPLDPDLLASLQSLCRHLGYFGIFEAEFIEEGAGGRRLLIDFNPRYYGQMGFEIARGLPLPILALKAAQGAHAELAVALDQAEQSQQAGQIWTYGTDWLLRLSLITGWIAGKHSTADLLHWRRWRKDKDARYTDAVYDKADRRPYYIDILLNILRYLQHPRDFIRKFFLDT